MYSPYLLIFNCKGNKFVLFTKISRPFIFAAEIIVFCFYNITLIINHATHLNTAFQTLHQVQYSCLHPTHSKNAEKEACVHHSYP